MAILFPNIDATLQRQTGFDLQGGAAWSAPSNIRVGIVTLRRTLEKSSVRADSSASRGRVEESRADGIVLVPANVEIGINDKLRLMGAYYRVAGMFPRHDLKGVLAHNQVELEYLSA
jgi:hypothetical protein